MPAKQSYKIQDPQPNNIVFMIDHGQTEVLRISKDGVWANPDFPADEVAKKALAAMDDHIKQMVERVRNEEREACAKVCEEQYEYYGHDHVFAKAIRTRKETK